ncbi:MAG TPA: ATP-binding protein, partial [Spirochaetota bacterium]|nr:ATP-binding protein [Spirochaetota bacterium]
FSVKPLKSVLMPVNLKDFLDKFLDFVLPELDTNHIKLKKNYGELPDIWLDENHLKQALLNLLQNSIHSIKEKGRDDGFIEIESYQEKNYVFINIVDNGKGIDENIRSKIFDPYFTTKSYGTGLGLTIVYKIIKEHNGDLSFSSTKGGETVFTLRFPIKHIEKGLIEYNGDKDGD